MKNYEVRFIKYGWSKRMALTFHCVAKSAANAESMVNKLMDDLIVLSVKEV